MEIEVHQNLRNNLVLIIFQLLHQALVFNIVLSKVLFA